MTALLKNGRHFFIFLNKKPPNMKIYAFALILLLGLSTCRKKHCKCHDQTNPDCENYDPCYGKTTVNSNFTVIPGTNGFADPDWCVPSSCDTLQYSSVRFIAPEGNTDNTTYEWQIGSDTLIRTSKKFEVNFYDYLQMGNWEKSIPVTLTIRRPLDNCLKKASDTLVVVTRNIFFTEKPAMVLFDKNTPTLLKGYFTSDPQTEINLKLFMLQKFRGKEGSLAGQGVQLVIGYPFADTLLNTVGGCGKSEECSSYRHAILKYPLQDCAFKNLTGYLYQLEYNFYENNKIRILRDCHFPTGFKQYEFIGTKQ